MNTLATERLRLVPATAALVQSEIENLPHFFQQLGVEPVSDWPSDNLVHVLPFFRDQLAKDPSLIGWLAWYWILDTSRDAQLVGGGGFKGFPANGEVEIGYETRASCRRKGIASEAVDAQVVWALNQPGVTHVTADVHIDNLSSIGLLRKLSFVDVGEGSECSLLRFEHRREAL